MVELTKYNEQKFLLNCDLIETIEETPDTVITLVNGKKIIVKENRMEIYDQIVNYEYQEGDLLSKALIDWYRELIFSADGFNEKQLKIISAMDRAMYLYVKENKYKKGLKKVLSENDISIDSQISIANAIKKILMFTNSYEKQEILEISSSMWL